MSAKTVEFTYKKIIKFKTEMDQTELDKIVLNEEIPDWVDKMMDDIDNEQPAELVGFRGVKEK